MKRVALVLVAAWIAACGGTTSPSISVVAEFVEEEKGDLLVLAQLASMNVDLSRPIGVILFFVMPDEDAVEEMKSYLEGEGFTVETMDFENEFLAVGTAEVVVSADVVSEWRSRLGQTAESLGGYYEGFEVGPLP